MDLEANSSAVYVQLRYEPGYEDGYQEFSAFVEKHLHQTPAPRVEHVFLHLDSMSSDHDRFPMRSFRDFFMSINKSLRTLVLLFPDYYEVTVEDIRKGPLPERLFHCILDACYDLKSPLRKLTLGGAIVLFPTLADSWLPVGQLHLWGQRLATQWCDNPLEMSPLRGQVRLSQRPYLDQNFIREVAPKVANELDKFDVPPAVIIEYLDSLKRENSAIDIERLKSLEGEMKNSSMRGKWKVVQAHPIESNTLEDLKEEWDEDSYPGYLL